MDSFRKVLQEADSNKFAVGHFNISDWVALKAVFESARELNVPIVVAAEVGKLYTHVPESIRLKETELTAEERRLANFVDFIGEGRGNRTLAQALFESERKVGALKEELESLHRCRGKVFQVPPQEWIQERLTKLKEILDRNADRSGLLLRKLLGPLRLEPTSGEDTDRPFYKATTSINTLALLDPLTGSDGREGSSNSLQWWTGGDSNP